jgi:hypothetical protein
VDVQPSAWDDPIAALCAGVPHTAWTVDDLDATHARAVEAGGRSVWTPRDTPEAGLGGVERDRLIEGGDRLELAQTKMISSLQPRRKRRSACAA